MDLQIDVVPGSNPPKFRWRQVVEFQGQRRYIQHEGNLPPSVEVAVVSLINLAKQQDGEIKALRKQVEGHCERIAAQSELLTKKAESPAPAPARGRKKEN